MVFFLSPNYHKRLFYKRYRN